MPILPSGGAKREGLDVLLRDAVCAWAGHNNSRREKAASEDEEDERSFPQRTSTHRMTQFISIGKQRNPENEREPKMVGQKTKRVNEPTLIQSTRRAYLIFEMDVCLR